MSLPDRLRLHLEHTGLIPPGSSVLVAVSGGTDSLALLYLLHHLRTGMTLDLAVGHVDHGIQAGSGEVASLVRGCADQLGLPFHQERLDLGPAATETSAREARYEALFRMREAMGAKLLATAHHADDQAETVLGRVLRGSGVLGLAGIPARRPDGVVRPLLGFRRVELEEWLAGQPDAMRPDEDAWNEDRRHDRAWIRHDLLPLIRNRKPDIDRDLLALAEHARANTAAWEEVLGLLPGLDPVVTDGAAHVDRAALMGYPNVLTLAILKHAARGAGCVLGTRHAQRIVDFLDGSTSGHHLELPGNWVCEIALDRVRIRRVESAPEVPEALPWSGTDAGKLRWGPWQLAWRPEPAGPVSRDGRTTWVTPGPGTIRGLQPGDRVRPLGGTGHRRAVELLMEHRIPRERRPGFPVVERDGEVLWLPGVCRSDYNTPALGAEAIRIDVIDDEC